jgi:hypothetical protein
MRYPPYGQCSPTPPSRYPSMIMCVVSPFIWLAGWQLHSFASLTYFNKLPAHRVSRPSLLASYYEAKGSVIGAVAFDLPSVAPEPSSFRLNHAMRQTDSRKKTIPDLMEEQSTLTVDLLLLSHLFTIPNFIRAYQLGLPPPPHLLGIGPIGVPRY